MADQPDLVVLHSLRPPDGTTKYTDLVVGASQGCFDLRYFSWRAALSGRYDALHVHWPELLIRDTRQPWRRFLRRRLLDLLLLRLRLQRVPLVWTAHNLAPHESGPPAERRSLQRLTRQIDLTIRLNPASEVSVGREIVTIPHHHYRPAFERHPQPPSEPGRVLHFGIIRPYKGVEDLIRTFRGLPNEEVKLRVVGHPHPGQAEAIQSVRDGDERVELVLRFVDDHELVDEICRCQLVVLPYRGAMHNSGSLLAALSLDRPVLVPASPTNEALSHEAGPGWVIQYHGELTSEILQDAVRASAVHPAAPPQLTGRDWNTLGLAHREAYLRAVASRRAS